MNAYFYIIVASLSLLGIAWVFFVAFPRLRRDQFRNDIRQLRDELFDFMLETNRDFGLPGYVKMRGLLNSIIVISNWLDPIKFFMIAYHNRKLAQNGYPTPDLIGFVADDELRSKMENIRERLSERLVRFVFCEGLTGFAIICCVATIRFLQKIKAGELTTKAIGIKSWTRKRSEEFLKDAPLVRRAYGIRGLHFDHGLAA